MNAGRSRTRGLAALAKPVLVLPVAVALAVGLGAGAPANEEIERPPPPAADLVMQAVEDRPQDPLDRKLGHAEVADTRDWPATFRTASAAEAGQVACTATLIAARTLLIAAHCVVDGGRVTLERREGPSRGTSTGRCMHAPAAAPPQMSEDWALCLMDEDVPARRYERISLDPALLSPAREIRLAGFGCTEHGQTPDGKFRIGLALLAQLPGALSPPLDGERSWAATAPDGAGASSFTCLGDSGGAAFVEMSGNRRFAVAVNSARPRSRPGVSLLSALSVRPAQDFILRWAQDHGQHLCGVHSNARNCR